MIDKTIKKNKKVVSTLWYHYDRRLTVLSDYLHARTIFVNHLIQSRGKLWKLFFWVDYFYKAIYTLSLLVYFKPEVVIAASPPSLCPVFCGIYCKIFKKNLVVDAHNSAFQQPWISVPFYLKILQLAKVVIVHNYEYENYLKKKYANIKFIALHDKIPEFQSNEENKLLKCRKYFLIVLSYSYDEPLIEIFDAIKSFLSKEHFDIIFKITGNYKKKLDLYNKYNDVDGIEFLGFVEKIKYDNLLYNAFGVIALTTSQMLQQCAGMEAIGAKVPVIVSDTDIDFCKIACYNKVVNKCTVYYCKIKIFSEILLVKSLLNC